MGIRDLFVLAVVVSEGFWYYKLATSKSKMFVQLAFALKIAFLILSFILAFVGNEFILIGDSLAFGGRSAVMMIIAIEIADAFVDRKNNKM